MEPSHGLMIQLKNYEVESRKVQVEDAMKVVMAMMRVDYHQ